MASIKLKSIKFDAVPFRKLRDLKINFADRITVLAGHNGMGKSTILALISNSSGDRDASRTSYFNRTYEANLNEIVHLDYDQEYEQPKAAGASFPAPIIDYEVDNKVLSKKSAITGRTERREVRVVPRNDPHKLFLAPDGELEIGPDAKIPLPTLYLGMTRMLPIGESAPASVTTLIDKSMVAADVEFIQKFINSVIPYTAAASREITTQSIKGTRKTAKHPAYMHNTRCISLGQDSLGAIATALASFKKLEREWADYPGGLLVIDEIDAGFHPHAQAKLVTALASAAKKLRLQVVATTHSMNLIELVHPDSNPVGGDGKRMDAVVYLADTQRPSVAEGYSLEEIKRDMSLTPPPPPPVKAKDKKLKIYLEDPEAHFFLTRLLTRSLKLRIRKEAGVGLVAIPLSTGCENLKGFIKHDPYFKSVIIVLDADASLPAGRVRNVARLPGGKSANGSGLSPERSLHAFITTLAENNEDFPVARAALRAKRITSNYLTEHMLSGDTNIQNRDSAKKWMNRRLTLIEQWGIVDLWIAEHPAEVAKFADELVAACVATGRVTW